MLTHNQLLALLQLPNMGRKSTIAIADYAKQTKTVLESATDLYDFLEFCKKQKVVRALKTYLPVEIETALALASKIEDDAAQMGVNITVYSDAKFPKGLKRLKKDGKSDTPAVIFSKGDLEQMGQHPSIAIIGTRSPSMIGSIASTHFAEEFAKGGFNIVSGLALGCDTAAHRGALNVGGKTTAILAHGLDSVYPPENKALLQEIVDNGGWAISEYPIGIKPQQIYFVERDRLQAGLAEATLVVEAEATSGARHAVKTALNNQKEAFCTELSSNVVVAEEGSLFAEIPTLLNENNLQDTILRLKEDFFGK